MASTIIGTFPVINKKSSYIDDVGVERVVYNFTVPTSQASQYIPRKGQTYYGPSTGTKATPPVGYPLLDVTKALYLVTEVTADDIPGGLTNIIVTTAGLSDSSCPPVIRILGGYPYINGLRSYGYGYSQKNGGTSPNLGVAVQVTYAVQTTNLNQIGVYSFMPTSINGLFLPLANTAPFYTQKIQYTGDRPNQFKKTTTTRYYGFVAKSLSTDTDGGAIRVRIIFAESGYELVQVTGPDSFFSETYIYQY